MESNDELVDGMIKAMERLKSGDPALNTLASYLYKADHRLYEYLDKLKIYTELEKPTPQQTQDAGKLLEKIVFLLFKGLEGLQSVKSFQSAGPQYDLLVSGDDIGWKVVCKTLYLEWENRDIVIEAKATKSPLEDKQFARLCSIMEHNLRGAGLGIFVTLNGASGFPKRDSTRQRAVSDCRLRQIIFHARTNKIIVVLDKEDLFQLTKNGTLIEILIRKIRDLSELSGLPTTPAEQFQEIDLPTHLKMLYHSNG
ncbi:hypothetical protein [Dendronalium sp. ChiSLP03b]|uniref:hypothetical protein n=1 Tax=Dendronalium sp. ChiSLP03b TaxID=3075381 RepID=UPI002AD22FFB|nr:hypothetical protein [Dendronalium sp. ChiSLP03b]MDZ8204509.1 hypothetical protein [Dendronalium sp. ChiSLP03b]